MKTILWPLLLGFTIRMSAANVEEVFRNPPEAARPQVYWMWMGCNISAKGITGDLEALKDAGYGGTVLLSLSDICTPWAGRIAGSPTPEVITFSEPWWKLVRHAAAESRRLGLEFGFHNCAGYETSGGPWMPPELSMQEVVWSETKFTGPGRFSGPLPRPRPDLAANQPFPVYNGDTGKLEKPEVPARRTFFKDIAVLAVPATGDIATNQVFDLSDRLAADGTLAWDAPAGDWVILRFGHTTTGAMLQPCQWEAIGLECDKMNRAAVEFHLDHLIANTKKHAGDLIGHGLDFIWFDSYEAGTPGWTPGMAREFETRRGYDLKNFLPTLAGRTVGGAAETRKFKADFRRTIFDLYRDNYFAVIPRKLHAAGLKFRCEPYEGPWVEAEVLPYVDGVTTEFWVQNGKYNPTFVPRIVAAARRFGVNAIDSEAFTASPGESMWTETPAKLKPVGDAAFCGGVNRFVLHRFTHQPWADKFKPGFAMGQWGTHFDRTQTWWEPGKAMVSYWQRCDALLQWGAIATNDALFGGVRDLNLKSIHRSDGATDVYFVANLAWEKGGASCVFGVTGRQPELWNPVTGTIRDLPEFQTSGDKTVVPLEFAPTESCFVVFRKPASATQKASGFKNFPALRNAAELTGAWTVKFDPKWGGPEIPVEFTTLDDWSHHAEPGIKYYSGTAVYEKDFDLPPATRGGRLFLDLGMVRDIASVSLNGHDLGVVWTAPWQTDITAAARPKGNRLAIKVTNCWANRLIGDEQQPPDCEFGKGDMGHGGPLKAFPEWALKDQPRPSKGRFTFATWNYFDQTSPLSVSGLLGPVAILMADN